MPVPARKAVYDERRELMASPVAIPLSIKIVFGREPAAIGTMTMAARALTIHLGDAGLFGFEEL